MDILFITLSPIDSTFSMSFRNRSVLRGFVELGHTVDILTIYPYDANIQINKLEIAEYVNIIRINNNPQKTSNKISLKKGKNNFTTRFIRSIYHRFMPFDSSYFLIRSIKADILPKKKYDILISSSDPKTSHLAAKRLINTGLSYTKWIQYWGDPLASDITSKLLYPKNMLKWLERRILKDADKIIYVSPITLKEQVSFFKDLGNKMTFLPIPYEKVKIYPETNNKVFTIGYFGFYLQAVRNIIPLYKAVKNSNVNIHLDIVGPTDIQLNNQINITIHPNTNDVSAFELKTDLMVVILNLHGGQIPGKLYHLAATNKPILVIMDGDYKQIIQEYLNDFDRYILCDNTEESISKAINNLLLVKREYFPSPQLEPVSISRQFLQ